MNKIQHMPIEREVLPLSEVVDSKSFLRPGRTASRESVLKACVKDAIFVLPLKPPIARFTSEWIVKSLSCS